MAFIKQQKTKAYFKRYQVKYRRRREGKTDYFARRRLCIQDKNKFNTPKYRMVVRITNKDVVCQIVTPKIEGDHILCAAYSHELKNYGLPAGISSTNYASAYATGLLLARRMLSQIGLGDIYKGVEKADGQYYAVADSQEADKQSEMKDNGENGKRPFRLVLDVGLARTTTGAKVFGALKGAVDGGLDIPHSTGRFPGASGKSDYDAGKHRHYIFGGHVADYMRHLKEEDGEAYQKQFSALIKAGLNADNIEKTFAKVHASIRSKPTVTKKARKAPAKKLVRKPRLSAEQKKARARTRYANLIRKAQLRMSE
jgi:large subunit ribosomal protein L5e